MADKTCFIIMPVSTPESMIEMYLEDTDHFKHVLEYLFIPAIEKSGFSPIAPLAKGADLIHAEIIKNLESSNLVLCDITSYNPNVFFELGYRTSLNKPVCHVKDNFTDEIPFDQSIINHYTYGSGLFPWNIKNEIESLSNHIKESNNRSNKENTLWKYFGIKSTADPLSSDWSANEVLNFLLSKLDSISDKVNGLSVSKFRAELEKVESTLEYRDKASKLALMLPTVEREETAYKEELAQLTNSQERYDNEKILELEKKIKEKRVERIRIQNAIRRAILEDKA